MDAKPRIDAAEALGALFQVVRDEALSNPKFARRLLEAVGFTVEFRGEEALAAVDPILVAMRGRGEFRRTFISMKLKDVVKIGKDSNLIESHEFEKMEAGKKKKKNIGEIEELLWERSSERMRDLVPTREAAE
jgi:hypothetical protein